MDKCDGINDLESKFEHILSELERPRTQLVPEAAPAPTDHGAAEASRDWQKTGDESTKEKTPTKGVFWSGPRHHRGDTKSLKISPMNFEDIKNMFKEMRTLNDGQNPEDAADDDGYVPRDAFVASAEALQLDLGVAEMERLFLKIDQSKSGRLSFSDFRKAWKKHRLLQTIVSDYNHPDGFAVADTYDFTSETYKNLAHADYKVLPHVSRCCFGLSDSSFSAAVLRALSHLLPPRSLAHRSACRSPPQKLN